MAGKRTVQVNARAVSDLRIQKGWTAEDLAGEAGCSLKTVQNAESGKPIFVFTLASIAKALGVEPSQLMAEGLPSTLRPALEIEFVLRADKEQLRDYPSFYAFVELLERMVALPDSPIKLKSIAQGSVIVALEVSEEVAQRLLTLMPCFREAALEVIEVKIEKLQRQNPDYAAQLVTGIYRKSGPGDEGYYTSWDITKTDPTASSWYLGYLSNMWAVAKAVHEMRVPVEPRSAGSLPDEEDVNIEVPVDPELLRLAGYPFDGAGTS